ncbi:hypothetical protein [Thalassoglobus sp.]|uniref:hypothetical protein n=1 Tax=Thalassoglobus sp. TaxID=2795869 RepID=UPI003AA80075
MPGIRNRAITGFALLATACGLSSPVNAQFFGSAPCGPCGTAPVASIAPTFNCGPVAYAPAYQTASVNPCPCLKTVQEPVYQTVEVPEMVPVQKTVKVAKVITEMQDREVTTYQTVNEVKTVNVPSYITQTVNECRQVTRNDSYWQTAYQPVPKMSPCAYDGRPGLVGEFNRLGYAFRNSITPNVVARRQFVPNVVAYNVPVQRTVQIPTTRQVSYNVSRQVPVTTVQKVPVQRTVYVDEQVTAYETRMKKQTVFMGNRTKVVYDSNFNGTATAAEPTPATTAGGDDNTQSAGGTKGNTKLQSFGEKQTIPLQSPVYRDQFEPAPAYQEVEQPTQKPVATQPTATPSAVRVATWKATTRSADPTQIAPVAPELVAQK